MNLVPFDNEYEFECLFDAMKFFKVIIIFSNLVIYIINILPAYFRWMGIRTIYRLMSCFRLVKSICQCDNIGDVSEITSFWFPHAKVT